MPRPKPEIITSVYINDQRCDILSAPSMYAVTYQGKLFGLRVETGLDKWQGYKYKKTVYPNVGSAIRQVKTLNEQFDCEDFGYIEINQALADCGVEYTDIDLD
jgi:hypothetical protein